MHTYLVVSFWLLVSGTTIRMFELALQDHWPVERNRTLGMHLFETLVDAGFLVWAAWLLWWKV